MIKTLRKRFIRIAVLAVTAVLLMLCLIVNIANYASVDRDLIRMLQMISGNQGTVPQMPQGVKPDGKQGGGFTPETPFSTRYFVLRYDDEGVLVNADLGSIAAVTTDDTTAYLQVATKHGVGYGWSNGYRYYVVKNGENHRVAFTGGYAVLRGVCLSRRHAAFPPRHRSGGEGQQKTKAIHHRCQP